MNDVLFRIEAIVPGAQYEGYASTQAEWDDAGDPNNKPLPRPPFIRWNDERAKPSWAELMAVVFPVPPRAVSKLKIVERLNAAGLLETAYTALSQQPLVTQKRWEAAQTIASDDAETREFLTAIGADPDAILA